MKIFSSLVIVFFLLSLVSCKKEETQPNILFIFSDDHTSQSWGIYGGLLEDYVQNDNIKRLAREGMVLENAFCTNSICSPSRAAVLTGQYSHVNQVYTLSEPLPEGHPNIAKSLREGGYQTALFGKWHLVKQPEGFDTFLVLPGQGRYHDPIFKTKNSWQDGYQSENGIEYRGFSTDVITDMSLDYLDKRDKDKPFALFCQFKATHEPFDYPERLADLYIDEEIPEPASLYDFSPETTGRTFIGQKLENLGERWERASTDSTYWTSYPGLPYSLDGLDSLERRKKIYQKFIKDFMRCGAAIDENIGRILDYLDKEGLADNTIVIYTSDQGYFLGEHGFFDKRLMYEESLRMPFVIRYPKKIKAGQRIKDMVLNIDFAPTIADFAGIGELDFAQGKSAVPSLTQSTDEEHRSEIYYRYWLHWPVRPAHFGIRNERYKLIFFYGQPLAMKGTSEEVTPPAWEFYDLEKDLHELHNAYGESEYHDIISTMKVQLDSLREVYGDTDEKYPEMKSILNEGRGL